MARELRRLLIDPGRLAALGPDRALPLQPAESRYLTRVLRYGPGDALAVIDGCGRLWCARLIDGLHLRLETAWGEPQQQQPPPRPRLVLAAAVVRRDFEVLVRMAVELGVDTLIPLLCERTAVQGQLRPERWQSIATEAAEQCERLWLPQLEPPQTLAALLAAASGPEQRRCWATTRQPGLPSLAQALQQQDQQAALASQALWLACGPEGGWTEAEERQALAAGWQAVNLGPRILRSSTAAVAGLSWLSGWRADHCGC